MRERTIASANHKEPCTICRKKIKKGDHISVYATAGGGMDDGLIYWMHDDCRRSQGVADTVKEGNRR